MNNNQRRYLIILLCLVAFYVRYDYQKDKALWIDEAKTACIARDGSIVGSGGRELFQVIWYRIFNVKESEFWLRFPIMVASSVMILILYVQFGFRSIPFVLLIALHPYFVHWGSLARPYSLAGLFVILGFRQKWWYVLAVMCSPFSIIGINFWRIRERWLFYLILGIVAVGWYWLMPLSRSSHFNWEFLSHATRLYYVPLVSLFAHLLMVDRDKLAWLRSYFPPVGGDDM